MYRLDSGSLSIEKSQELFVLRPQLGPAHLNLVRRIAITKVQRILELGWDHVLSPQPA